MEKIKTILIVCLILLALTQISNLWLDYDINYNVAKYEIKKDEKKNELDYYIKPNNVIISFGNKKYSNVKQTRVESTLINSYISQIYKNTLNNKNLKESEITVEELYNKKAIILEYLNEYEIDEFKEIFNIQSDKIAKIIKAIRNVYICPENISYENNKNIFMVYIENAEGTIFEFELNFDSTELVGLIDEVNIFNQLDEYKKPESINQVNYATNIIVPDKINDNSLTTRKPLIINPLSDSEKIEEYANIFFENPKAKWNMKKDENIIIYGDGNKSVRIYNTGYVEYTYNSQEDDIRKISFTLSDAIKNAEKMLQKDIYINNEVYITSIRKIDSDIYKICYNYRINGFEEVIDLDILQKYNLSAPLEIVVSSQNVISYKRILEYVTFEQSISSSELVPYQEVVNTLLKLIDETKEVKENKEKIETENRTDNKTDNKNENQSKNIFIEDVKLLYYKEIEDEMPKLVWYIKCNNQIFTFDALRGIK